MRTEWNTQKNISTLLRPEVVKNTQQLKRAPLWGRPGLGLYSAPCMAHRWFICSVLVWYVFFFVLLLHFKVTKYMDWRGARMVVVFYDYWMTDDYVTNFHFGNGCCCCFIQETTCRRSFFISSIVELIFPSLAVFFFFFNIILCVEEKFKRAHKSCWWCLHQPSIYLAISHLLVFFLVMGSDTVPLFVNLPNLAFYFINLIDVKNNLKSTTTTTNSSSIVTKHCLWQIIAQFQELINDVCWLFQGFFYYCDKMLLSILTFFLIRIKIVARISRLTANVGNGSLVMWIIILLNEPTRKQMDGWMDVKIIFDVFFLFYFFLHHKFILYFFESLETVTESWRSTDMWYWKCLCLEFFFFFFVSSNR